MKRVNHIFIAYFPILLVAGQVFVNLLSFVFPKAYIDMGFYLNWAFGTNGLYALCLLSTTFTFRLCKISRAAAIAECAFALLWVVRPTDDRYNILFQIIVGLTALAFTFRNYMDKFPLCRMSLLVSFINSVVKKRSCEKGLNDWDTKVKGLLLKKHHERNL